MQAQTKPDGMSDPRPHPRCDAPKKSGLAGPWRARPGSDEMKGGPDRWVTWGVGGDRDRALLRRGPKENSTASAALSRSAIILWCGEKRASGLARASRSAAGRCAAAETTTGSQRRARAGAAHPQRSIELIRWDAPWRYARCLSCRRAGFGQCTSVGMIRGLEGENADPFLALLAMLMIGAIAAGVALLLIH